MNDRIILSLPDSPLTTASTVCNLIEIPKNDRNWGQLYIRRIDWSITGDFVRNISSYPSQPMMTLASAEMIMNKFLEMTGDFEEDEKPVVGAIVHEALFASEQIRNHYKTFQIPKKSGGVRTIEAPDDVLKKIQRTLLNKLWYPIGMPSKCSHGFVPKRGTLTNATAHFVEEQRKKRVLLKMDLRDFFTSISFFSLYNQIVAELERNISGYDDRYQYVPNALIEILYRYSKELDCVDNLPVATSGFRTKVNLGTSGSLVAFKALLVITYAATKLCCVDGRLPQGSPCSPVLVNIFMQKFNAGVMSVINRIHGEHPDANITYTIYADDLCVTASETRYVVKMKGILENMIRKYPDISQNQEKTCIFKPGQPQRVTGIEITDKVSISRKARDKVRAELHNAACGKVELTYNDKMRLKGMRSWMRGVDAVGWDTRCEKDYQKVIDI